MTPYEPILARIHDEAFTDHARAAARTLIDHLTRGGVSTGLIVDLGSGSGVFAGILTDAGFDVLGIDVSEAMVELARRTAPRASFRCESFIDAELPVCVAVTAIGEVLNYAFDDRAGISAVTHLFSRTHAALRPGGAFMFDIATPGRGSAKPCQRHWITADWAMLSTTQELADANVLTRRITTFVGDGDGGAYRRSEEVHRLHLYAEQDIRTALEETNFAVEVVRAYGSRPFPPGYAAFIATRS